MKMYYTECEKCPECGSDDIQIIDRVWNEEEQVYEDRYTCWACNNDWHQAEEFLEASRK